MSEDHLAAKAHVMWSEYVSMVLDFCQVFGHRWVLAKKQHGHPLGGTISRLCDSIILHDQTIQSVQCNEPW